VTIQQSSPPRPPRRRPAPIRVHVARVERLAPRLVRIAFTGPDLHRFVWPGPGSHLKVFLPEPGADDVALPEPDADGMVTFDRPLTSRTYTPRRYDAHAGELEIDFVVHGHGPASRWAAAAQPGDRAAVSIPRATYQVSPDADALLLAGDESALPAIATILASCPEGLAARVLAEVHGADDETALPGSASVEWLHRGDEPAGSLLERALSDAPAEGTAVWVATEASAVRRIRALLLERHGLPRERVVTRGYWREDTPNHPDHDFGEDEIPTR
jgi:NADPH-dependent ferric siderophore reductase